MELAHFIGTAGGIVSSVTFLPQVIKIWKTKSAKDLSMMTLFFLILNVSLWLTYGVMITDFPLMITNSIVLCMILCMVYFKLKFKEKTQPDGI